MSEEGRRERKKAQTRKSIAEAALELFLRDGYDAVAVKDIAARADVSQSTLFQHFPSKEAMAFDRDDELEAALVAAVRERDPDTSIPSALRRYVVDFCHLPAEPELAAFRVMVETTPVLRHYAHRMWMRHEDTLASVIAEEAGAPQGDSACAALAHFALESRTLVGQAADPEQAAEAIFGLLERGWDNVPAGQ